MMKSLNLNPKRLAISLAVLLAALALAFAAYMAIHLKLFGQGDDPQTLATHDANGAQSGQIPDNAWQVIRASSLSTQPAGVNAEQVLRYVGPFFKVEGEGADAREVRSAIVELIEGGKQDFVQVGDVFESYEITRIEPSSMTVRNAGMDYELRLSFTSVVEQVSAAKSEFAGLTNPDETVFEESKYGKRIGENRWVISRQSILDYYAELQDAPERLVAIFDSLEPDYTGEGKIQGYQLVTKGEAEFFKSIGMQEKDFVRKVNSMNMTSRLRAEYFIGEFMKERLGGVVLDIERDGKPVKLIYFVR